ncbi:MAG: hypothetical protein ACLFPD_05565 [Desulfosudaceae bacterium]
MSEPSIALALPPQKSLLAETIIHLGYPGPAAVSQKVMTHVDREIRRCLELARPQAMCRITPFQACRNGVIQAGDLCLQTVNWSRLVNRMTRVRWLCCLALTLGGAVDETIAELGRDRLTASFILDAAASALAELLAAQAQEQVERYGESQGLQASRRFSPGYCDWQMKDGQEALGGFLHPEGIGIQTAPASGMMTPRKSITAVIVAAEQMPARTPCYLLVRECPHRRAPYQGAPSRRISSQAD